MEILFFLLVIVLLFMVVSLRGRVARLEQMQGRVVTTPVAPAEMTGPSYPAPGTVLVKERPVQEVPVGPGAFEKLGDWLKEDWLLKLGALLLLIGFGWLTSYAFAHNWIGPMGRIMLGLVAGALFMVLGWWRALKYPNQGSIFLVLGSTVILLTTFAAREIYDFFTPLSALVVMFLSTAFVALASVKLSLRSLSLVSLILAGIAPLLTNSPNDDYISLFAYLLVVVLGAIWIVIITGHRALATAAVALVTLYSLSHLFDFSYADKSTLLLFSYAFASIFFLANISGIIKNVGGDSPADIVTAGGNGLLLLAWITQVAPREWQSLIISAWMLVFVAGAFLVFRVTKRQVPFLIYSGVGVVMLAAATAAELSGPALTIAYTIESGILVMLAYSLLNNIKLAEKLSFLFLGPILMSFESMNLYNYTWTNGVFHDDFVVLLVLGFSLLVTGYYLALSKFGALLAGLGSVWLYILLWLSLHAKLASDDMAAMICLIIFTLIGLASYFYGLLNTHKYYRLYGAALLVFVVGRLLTVDVWKMELDGKIVTFFLVGALLMSTAFLGKRRQNLIRDNNPTNHN